MNCKLCKDWDKEVGSCSKEISELDDPICLQKCTNALLVEIIYSLREGEEWKNG